MTKIPEGYVQCEVCGEFNGSTDERNLANPNGLTQTGSIGVSCLCKGIPCRRCKTELIHRPGSNTYYPDSNTVWHTPGFWGMIPCKECAEKERVAKESRNG